MKELVARLFQEQKETKLTTTCTLGEGADITITNDNNSSCLELTISEAEKLRADLSKVIKQAKELDTIYSKDYSK